MTISCLVFFSYFCSEMRDKSITAKYMAMTDFSIS